MSDIMEILISAICMLFLGFEYWVVYHRGDKNAHRVFLVGIVLGASLELLGLLLSGAYKDYFVDNDDDDDANNDHGLGASGDRVIINITELASVSRSILIRSIPVVGFSPRKFEDGVECVVCLSELEEGDKAKLLPSCKHWFHAHCIDAWLESHATCPICRTRVRLFKTNEPSSRSNLTCSYERSADVTSEVVIDIPT
ncbi:putative RING-H2 finger protein ATL61 [Raphanus sativus]|uniref:RING-type E3 ubiquitin transferase n=1 Tax=Raphanus sativus TaxID=3726 RepID=A0A6J0LLA4_RAPSA|nr:putative RING-H2 finger protein ATL61 [Raphanus sativus]